MEPGRAILYKVSSYGAGYLAVIGGEPLVPNGREGVAVRIVTCPRRSAAAPCLPFTGGLDRAGIILDGGTLSDTASSVDL